MRAALRFSKMQGTGNDFVFVNAADLHCSHGQLPAALRICFISRLCDRHFGIGADGLIVVASPARGEVTMEYYNADGSAAAFCGNGARCVARYASMQGWIDAVGVIRAAVGEVQCQVRAGGEIAIHMPDATCPTYVAPEDAYLINTGVPHLVKEAAFSAQSDFIQWAAPRSENESLAPGGVNVNAYRYDGDELRVHTYERGVNDETLSCGTGAVATVITAMFIAGKSAGASTIYTRGGRLNVSFDQCADGSGYQNIWLAGSAECVAEGMYYYDIDKQQK